MLLVAMCRSCSSGGRGLWPAEAVAVAEAAAAIVGHCRPSVVAGRLSSRCLGRRWLLWQRLLLLAHCHRRPGSYMELVFGAVTGRRAGRCQRPAGPDADLEGSAVSHNGTDCAGEDRARTASLAAADGTLPPPPTTAALAAALARHGQHTETRADRWDARAD